MYSVSSRISAIPVSAFEATRDSRVEGVLSVCSVKHNALITSTVKFEISC